MQGLPPGLLAPGLMPAPAGLPAPWLYPGAVPPLQPPTALPQPLPSSAPQSKATELSERDARLLKRKQANRDSARRSKLKKKQETEELVVRRAQLSEVHQELIQKIRDAQTRVRQLQEANGSLKAQYTGLIRAAEGGGHAG